MMGDHWLERAFDDAGYWGAAQMRYAAIALLVQFCGALTMVNNVFVGRKVRVECAEPLEISLNNATSEITITPVSDACDYSKCNRNQPAKGEWPSIASEWQLYYDQAYRVDLVQSACMFGVLVGAPVWGMCSDAIGRRRSTLLSGLVTLLATCASCVANGWHVFTVTRAVAGFGNAGFGMITFVLAGELMASSHRATFAMFGSGMFAVGIAFYAVLAYFSHHWRFLMFLVVLVTAATLLCCWLVAVDQIFRPHFWLYGVPVYLFSLLPESPRWLASMRRNEESHAVLTQIAKLNKRELNVMPEDVEGHHAPKKDKRKKTKLKRSDGKSGADAEFLLASTSSDEDTTDISPTARSPRRQLSPVRQAADKESLTTLLYSAIAVKWLFIQMYSWLAASMVYYGLTMASGDGLSDNYYVGVALNGLIEVPAYVVVIVLQTRIGRRWLICGPFLLASVSSLAVHQLPILALIAKAGVSAAFAVVWLHSAELFPTGLRVAGLGLCSMSARVGGMTAPVIPMFTEYFKFVFIDQFVIFGVIGLVAATFHLTLPETRGKQLPATMQEMIQLADKRTST